MRRLGVSRWLGIGWLGDIVMVLYTVVACGILRSSASFVVSLWRVGGSECGILRSSASFVVSRWRVCGSDCVLCC